MLGPSFENKTQKSTDFILLLKKWFGLLVKALG